MGTMNLDVVTQTGGVRPRPAGEARRARLTPNLFGIAFGFAGVAQAWTTAAELFAVPPTVGDALWLVTAVTWAALISLYARDVIADGRTKSELSDPTFAPFVPVAPIVAMLLGVAFAAHAHEAGTLVFAAGLGATVLLGGWLVGQWILSDIDLAQWHPGYFIPTVAGGYLASSSSAALGYDTLARLMFGYATVSWLMLGSILLSRLFTGPPLPVPLLPTMAIQVAPPVVAGTAWFEINGGRVDTVALGLAGYAGLMALVQVRLARVYRTVPFGPGYWAFAFSYAAVFVDALHWLAAEHAARATAWSYVLLASLSASLAALTWRTALALTRGTFFPVPAGVLQEEP